MGDAVSITSDRALVAFWDLARVQFRRGLNQEFTGLFLSFGIKFDVAKFEPFVLEPDEAVLVGE